VSEEISTQHNASLQLIDMQSMCDNRPNIMNLSPFSGLISDHFRQPLVRGSWYNSLRWISYLLFI